MGKRRRSKPDWQRATASERISALAASAGREARERPERASRYAGLALKIAMRYNMRLPAGLKRSLCRKCGAYLLPGSGCRVRCSGGVVITTCLRCGCVSRRPYGPKTPHKQAKG